MIDSLTSSAGNYVKSPLSSSGPGGKLGKDEFLKLLVAQMKNQDPMNPMNADQMAAQLAQFSTVEQLTQLNATVTAQQDAQAAMVNALHASTAMGLVGKTVTAVGDQVAVPEGGEATVHVRVGDAGGVATLKVFDGEGREVGSRALGTVVGGKHEFELGSAARDLAPGKYTYRVEVKDPSSGNPVPVQTYTVGRIDGVRYGQEGPVLMAGKLTIAFGSVVEIGAAD